MSKIQIRSAVEQIEAWRVANQEGGFGIDESEFMTIAERPELSALDEQEGFLGACLFYGFAGEGTGINSDMMLSSKIVWEYAVKSQKTLKWGAVRFDDVRWTRPRKEAHSRPIGFYWKKVQLGHPHRGKSVNEASETVKKGDWGMGPEGIQFVAVTHPDYASEMTGERNPYLLLLDYENNTSPAGLYANVPSLACPTNRGAQAERLEILGLGKSVASSMQGVGLLR